MYIYAPHRVHASRRIIILLFVWIIYRNFFAAILNYQRNFEKIFLAKKEKMSATTNSQSTPLYKWKDVTSKFRDACSELETGELIKDKKYWNYTFLGSSHILIISIIFSFSSSFGLFEAMSAIEMMVKINKLYFLNGF